MKNILTHLYYGNLNEAEKKVTPLYNTQEYARYKRAEESLEKTFSKEQQELYNKVCNLESAFHSLYCEKLYCNGVRTGMCIGLELVDFSPDED